MERYQDTGQYYNWYDHRTGAKLSAWPPEPQEPFHPILSSVDNGWLGGFRDSVNVQTKRVSDAYLSLDRGMIMAALGDDVLRKAFAGPGLERTLRPVIGAERFTTSP